MPKKLAQPKKPKAKPGPKPEVLQPFAGPSSRPSTKRWARTGEGLAEVIRAATCILAIILSCGCNRRQLVPEEVRLANGHSFNGYATDAEILAAFEMNPSAAQKKVESGENRTDTTYTTDRQTILVIRRNGHPGFYLRSSGAIATELFFMPADEIPATRP